MKKIFVLILSVLFVIPFTVYAAEKPAVTSLDADIEGSKITFSGTIESGSTAVMCKLYDADENEIDLLSTEVSNSNFSGDFTVSSEGDYVVSCANYDGGAIKTAEVKVEDVSEKEYTVDDGNGNEIIFTEENGHTYTLSIIDLLSLSDEELSIMGISKEEFEAGKKALEESAKDLGDVLVVLEIQLTDENGTEIHNGPFTIKIKLTDEMKKYNSFKITFIKDDNTLEDPIDLKVEGDYLVGTLNHLSTYVVTGSVNDPTPAPNPKTGDFTYVWIGALVVSVIALVGIVFISKKKEIA